MTMYERIEKIKEILKKNKIYIIKIHHNYSSELYKKLTEEGAHAPELKKYNLIVANWAIPPGVGYSRSYLKKLFGKEIISSGQRDFDEPNVEDIPERYLRIVSDDKVIATLDIDNRVLYCHFDVIHDTWLDGSSTEDYALDILEIFLDRVIIPCLEIVKIHTEYNIKAPTVNDLIQEAIIRNIKIQEDALLKEIDIRKKNIESITKQLIAEERRLFTLELNLRELRNLREKNITKIVRREISAIRKNPKVAKVFTDPSLPDTLIIETKRIYIYHDERKYYLGKYKIYINIAEGTIRFDNPKWRDDHLNCIHPHIKKTGDICYGNISTEISRLIGKYELAALVTLLISFLESYNHEDCYCKIYRFKSKRRR